MKVRQLVERLWLSKIGGTEDILEDGVNGFTIEWSDGAALTEHPRRFAIDRALPCRIGSASRPRVARFGWEGITRTYYSFFRAVSSEALVRGGR